MGVRGIPGSPGERGLPGPPGPSGVKVILLLSGRGTLVHVCVCVCVWCGVVGCVCAYACMYHGVY